MKSKKLYANATYVLGIDPSGAYDEGKGTTGWNIMCCATKEVIEVGTISALDYKTRMEYWDAHTQLIRRCANQYDKMVLSIEDYMLYKKAALSQVNSTFETVQLLGIIKFFAWNYEIGRAHV